MPSKRLINLCLFTAALVLAAAFQNCSFDGVVVPGSEIGSGLDSAALARISQQPLQRPPGANNSGGTTTGNGMVQMRLRVNVPALYGAQSSPVQNLRVCLSRMRFESPNGGKIEVKLSNFVVLIDPNETSLGFVKLPDGVYNRIELRFDGECMDDTISFTNSNGTFRTDRSVTVKFTGMATVVNGSADLLFDFAKFIEDLGLVDDDNRIAPTLLSHDYTFSDEDSDDD